MTKFPLPLLGAGWPNSSAPIRGVLFFPPDSYPRARFDGDSYTARQNPATSIPKEKCYELRITAKPI